MKIILTVVFAMLASGCVVVPVTGKGVNSNLVCHKGKQTLELPESAISAHINHGDYLGPCRP